MTVKIAILRGHGPKENGWDPGRVGLRNFPEAEITLAASYELKKQLERILPGCEVLLIRAGGTESARSLTQGVDKATAWGAKIFLSLHCNGHGTASANGMEVFYYNRRGYASARLARLVNEALATLLFPLGIRNRGVKTAKFTEIYRPKAHACLIEFGFITNKKDFSIIADFKNMPKLCGAVAVAVRRFLFGG